MTRTNPNRCLPSYGSRKTGAHCRCLVVLGAWGISVSFCFLIFWESLRFETPNWFLEPCARLYEEGSLQHSDFGSSNYRRATRQSNQEHHPAEAQPGSRRTRIAWHLASPEAKLAQGQNHTCVQAIAGENQLSWYGWGQVYERGCRADWSARQTSLCGLQIQSCRLNAGTTGAGSNLEAQVADGQKLQPWASRFVGWAVSRWSGSWIFSRSFQLSWRSFEFPLEERLPVEQLNPRFIVLKGPAKKPRIIDDCWRSGLHGAFTSLERLQLQDFDFVVSIAKLLKSCVQGGKSGWRWPMSLSWEAPCFHDWLGVNGWLARDLAKAYKQMAITEQSRHVSVVGVFEVWCWIMGFLFFHGNSLWRCGQHIWLFRSCSSYMASRRFPAERARLPLFWRFPSFRNRTPGNFVSVGLWNSSPVEICRWGQELAFCNEFNILRARISLVDLPQDFASVVFFNLLWDNWRMSVLSEAINWKLMMRVTISWKFWRRPSLDISAVIMGAPPILIFADSAYESGVASAGALLVDLAKAPLWFLMGSYLKR